MSTPFPTSVGYQPGDDENKQNVVINPPQPSPMSYPQYTPAPGQPMVAPPPYAGMPGQPAMAVPPGYPMPAQPMYQQPYGMPVTTQQQPYGMPVTTQPGQEQIQWMPAPTQTIPNCPRGLEYLATIDQLLVKQQIEILEMFTGFETANKYRVFNTMGQSLYFAVEDSEAISRQCFGSMRLFDMKILDNMGNEIIHFFRPYRCTACCCPGFLQQLEVTAPVGDVIGYITQLWSMSKQYFQIENEKRESILKIVGPYCTFSCGGDVIFKILSNDETTEVGTIRKQWSGLLREAYTDADNFGITFPVDLDVRMKAVMLGAVFLIDFMFYETKNQRQQHRRGAF